MLDSETAPPGTRRQRARLRADPAERRAADRLRVAVLGPSRYPVAEPYAGGLESFVGNLVAGLRARGHRVLLFAAAGSPGAQPEVLSGGGWRPDELARADASMPAEAFMVEHHSHLDVLTALRTTYAGEVDVVHNHSLHYLPLSLADTLPVPVVTTLHTPPTPWLTSALAAGGGSGAFTAVSSFTARQWAPWVPHAQVVLNGVEPRRWPLGPGGRGLLWFGRIVPEKAPHLALRAAARAGHHLDVVGPVGDEEYFAAQVAPRLGAGATYRGHLGGDDLARVVGRASAVLMTPSWDEPFGLVAAEAAMSGTPVVAFDRGGVSEVLRPHVLPAMGAVVPADDVEAMADAVEDVLALDRRDVRRAALAHLSFERAVSAYESILRSAAARTAVQLDVAAS
ncbi:glycosyltransferase involved in cell wall biosynthesis [Kineococcus radiotolerans]|uniref:Glycosyltransferase involved in cell wall biosynthesis n=1 Tax=Kineococcus radiotolerans TaxID=131568 RepID=A0A7W4XWU4_KINRA|nr:glycosyltransferase [Kineococcus radiotolerans]MBB2901441.1 glycosyltransferase involved in cell wall biosynthesis [Kineococcus radiotolerans]